MFSEVDFYYELLKGIKGGKILDVAVDGWEGRITRVAILMEDGREVYWSLGDGWTVTKSPNPHLYFGKLTSQD